MQTDKKVNLIVPLLEHAVTKNMEQYFALFPNGQQDLAVLVLDDIHDQDRYMSNCYEIVGSTFEEFIACEVFNEKDELMLYGEYHSILQSVLNAYYDAYKYLIIQLIGHKNFKLDHVLSYNLFGGLVIEIIIITNKAAL
jgi:hypothetical protein